jgi:ribosomal protein L37E
VGELVPYASSTLSQVGIYLFVAAVMVGAGIWGVIRRWRRTRTCPRCGRRVVIGDLDCPYCGFDFRTIGSPG